MNKLLYTILFFAVAGINHMSGATQEAQEGSGALIKAEKVIEKTLVTDPDAKSFTGLVKILLGDLETSECTSKLDIQQLYLLADKQGFHGVVILSMAQKIKSATLSTDDAIGLSLKTINRMSDNAIVLGEATPLLIYWKYFDEWPVFIKKIPDIKVFLSRAIIVEVVFSGITNDGLSGIINSESFIDLSPSLRGYLLQKAQSKKLIDLTKNEWQKPLLDLSDDPTGDGTYVYFLFSLDRGPIFIKKLTDYIVKFKDDRVRLTLALVAASEEIKSIDVMSLPINDRAKRVLLGQPKK